MLRPGPPLTPSSDDVTMIDPPSASGRAFWTVKARPLDVEARWRSTESSV
jgi:hypothetical protein